MSPPSPRAHRKRPRPPHAQRARGATPLSRVTEPAPEVRVTNVRKPVRGRQEPVDEERLFAEEGSAEGLRLGRVPARTPPAASLSLSPPPTPARGSRRHRPRQPHPAPRRSAGAPRWRPCKAASIRHGTALAHGRLLWLRPGEVGLAYAPTAAFHRGQVMGGSGPDAGGEGALGALRPAHEAGAGGGHRRGAASAAQHRRAGVPRPAPPTSRAPRARSAPTPPSAPC